MTAEERAALFKRLDELGPWHFDHEILPGVKTASFNRANYAEPTFRDVGLLDPLHLTRFFQKASIAGKSVLDVACNSGGYCFLAHTLGAKRVLGIEVRQHWLDQAEFVRAVKYPASAAAVEFRKTDIAAYLDSSDERFDITIFKGIFYHLPDPIGVLSRLCDRTRETILVDTDSSDAIPEACLIPFKESIKPNLMLGVDGLAWLPGGPAAIKPILEFKGFKFTEVEYWHHAAPPKSRGRFRIVGSRSPLTT